MSARRPREGAWIEMMATCCRSKNATGRPREGAWIEIILTAIAVRPSGVAPVWGRGLKSGARPLLHIPAWGRPRMGAWIEIIGGDTPPAGVDCRPREGAWIEILPPWTTVQRRFGRPHMGTWIEISGPSGPGRPAWCRPRMGASASADILQDRPKTMECSAEVGI